MNDEREWVIVKPEEILPAGLRFEILGDSAAIIDDGGRRVAAVRAYIEEDDDGEDVVRIELEPRKERVVALFGLETDAQRAAREKRDEEARASWARREYDHARATVDRYEAKHGRPTA